MKIFQLIYTSCEKGISGRAGFQFYSVSEGLTREEISEVEAHCFYIPPTDLPSQPNSDEIKKLFPKAFCYFQICSGKKGVAKISYSGKDYSGRYGNYIAHIMLWDPAEDDIDPMIFLNSNAFVDNLSDIHTSFSAALPVLEEVNKDKDVSIQSLSRYIRDNKVKVSSLLYYVLASVKEDKKLILLANDELIVYLLNIIYTFLPQNIADKTTFITYTQQPARSKYLITCVRKEGARFSVSELRYNSKNIYIDLSEPLAEIVDNNYIKALVESSESSDSLQSFAKFIKSCGEISINFLDAMGLFYRHIYCGFNIGDGNTVKSVINAAIKNIRQQSLIGDILNTNLEKLINMLCDESYNINRVYEFEDIYLSPFKSYFENEQLISPNILMFLSRFKNQISREKAAYIINKTLIKLIEKYGSWKGVSLSEGLWDALDSFLPAWIEESSEDVILSAFGAEFISFIVYAYKSYNSSSVKSKLLSAIYRSVKHSNIETALKLISAVDQEKLYELMENYLQYISQDEDEVKNMFEVITMENIQNEQLMYIIACAYGKILKEQGFTQLIPEWVKILNSLDNFGSKETQYLAREISKYLIGEAWNLLVGKDDYEYFKLLRNNNYSELLCILSGVLEGTEFERNKTCLRIMINVYALSQVSGKDGIKLNLQNTLEILKTLIPEAREVVLSKLAIAMLGLLDIKDHSEIIKEFISEAYTNNDINMFAADAARFIKHTANNFDINFTGKSIYIYLLCADGINDNELQKLYIDLNREQRSKLNIFFDSLDNNEHIKASLKAWNAQSLDGSSSNSVVRLIKRIFNFK